MLRRRRHAGRHRLTGLCLLLPSVKTPSLTPFVDDGCYRRRTCRTSHEYSVLQRALYQRLHKGQLGQRL